MAHEVAFSVNREALASVERLFDEVVAEDVLPKVLHRYLIVPAVVGTDDMTGPWDTPGSSRRVRTADGRAFREQVTAWQRPGHFAYRVDGFTGIMGALVDHAVGEWTFDGDAVSARFTWTYTFRATSRIATPLVRVFVAMMWAGYMRQCADRCVELTEVSRGPARS
jgi:hypothetical protein